MINAIKEGARSAIRVLRCESKSNIFWWQGPPYNAGDWVGPYLFKKISGIDPQHTKASNKSLTTVYLTVGSLTRWICENSIVWGSGLLDKDEDFWQPHATYAVRGPYTRERFLELGYPCPEIYGDPAILLPRYFNPGKAIEYRVGIVPHYWNVEEAVRMFKNNANILVIDIRKPLKDVISMILSCNRIVSSSLHGLIFAHSYGIPAGQIEFSIRLGGDGVKFLDYFASAGIFDLEKPLLISHGVTATALEDYVESSPQPELEPLVAPLLNGCPFFNREHKNMVSQTDESM